MSSLPQITPRFINFIRQNISEDISTLILKNHAKNLDFDLEVALTQIQCRRKTAKKLKRFIEKPNFMFPSTISAEQASHQAVAQFHESLISDNASLADLSAGLGIDVMSMGSKCSRIVAIEIEPLKAEYLIHNSAVCGIGNIEVICADSTEWVKEINEKFDIIFIDPSRRMADNKRAYNFHDCSPDVISLQELLRKRASRVFIKASPLLDITQTLRDITNVTSIRAICVDGECKEILVESAAHSIPNPKTSSNILIEAVDLDGNGHIISKFSYTTSPFISNTTSTITYAEEGDIHPGCFLYEPNAAIMKLAPWKEISGKYPDMKKIGPSSHLFVSNACHEDFPGRVLSIEKLIEKNDRKSLKGLPVNVAVRNYPVSAETLRKQLGTKEGSDQFVYGTRLKSPVLILAKRLQNLKPAVSTT